MHQCPHLSQHVHASEHLSLGAPALAPCGYLFTNIKEQSMRKERACLPMRHRLSKSAWATLVN
eukprot:3872436-Alexandrium_andersonii.AAC.1